MLIFDLGPLKISHLRLINLAAKAARELKLPPSDELSAHKLHSDLFASGFERILVVKNLPTIFPLSCANGLHTRR
jgi:hypothetical protein